MTTKYRIIIGFIVMVVLSGSIALIGYSSIETASDGFVDYRRLARFNTAMSDMNDALHRTAYNAYLFLDTRQTKTMDDARSALDMATKQIDLGKSYTRVQENKDRLEKMAKHVQSFRTQFGCGAARHPECARFIRKKFAAQC